MRKLLVQKAILIFVVFFLLIMTPYFFLIKSEMLNLVRERLLANAAAAALAYNGDLLEKIRPNNIDSYKKEILEVQKINTRLENIHPDIRFVYVMYKNEQKQIAFLVDSITTDRNGDGIISDDEKAAPIGEVYKNPTKYMLDAFTYPSADYEVNQDRWGRFLSGYAPIFNSRNEVVAIAGLDMLSNTLEQKMLPFYLTSLAVLIVGFVASIFLAKVLTKNTTDTF